MELREIKQELTVPLPMKKMTVHQKRKAVADRKRAAKAAKKKQVLPVIMEEEMVLSGSGDERGTMP
jgi:hypothetical protein